MKILKINPIIREDQYPDKVTVCDGPGGPAIASFYYQAGANGQPRFDALIMAEDFCSMLMASQKRPTFKELFFEALKDVDFRKEVVYCLSDELYKELEGLV